MTLRRIEICGGIASGKTTFAKLLSRLGFSVILEDFKSNPFWQAFYSDPSKYAFETEISFMLQHYHQIKKGGFDRNIITCDYSFWLDRAYAAIGLKGSHLTTFKLVYKEIRKELSAPELTIYLLCDPPTELSRIRERGRAVEAGIGIEFLETLNAAIETEMRLAAKGHNIVKIDSTRNNFACDEKVIEEMLKLVCDTFDCKAQQ